MDHILNWGIFLVLVVRILIWSGSCRISVEVLCD
jgi:hypothetical protein